MQGGRSSWPCGQPNGMKPGHAGLRPAGFKATSLAAISMPVSLPWTIRELRSLSQARGPRYRAFGGALRRRGQQAVVRIKMIDVFVGDDLVRRKDRWGHGLAGEQI